VERRFAESNASPLSGFNGATDFHRWKELFVAIGSECCAASMGPPIFIGGKMTMAQADTGRVSLQWGHRFSSVESAVCRTRTSSRKCFNGATDFHRWKVAWMEANYTQEQWLQWGHRFSSVESCNLPSAPLRDQPASMGPPIFIGGKGARAEQKRIAKALQWGHRFSSVERPNTGWMIDMTTSFNGATDFHR